MIEEGSKVTIHYTLKVDGQVVDTSQGRDPLTYVQGQQQIIAGLEEQLSGLQAGQSTEVTVPPERAYGLPDPKAVQEVPRTAFQDPESLQKGGVVQGKTSSGQEFQASVVELDAEKVILDLNHPLAGKTLTFEVEVVDVEAA